MPHPTFEKAMQAIIRKLGGAKGIVRACQRAMEGRRRHLERKLGAGDA